MNYYQHNVGDFAALTAGLYLESVGIVVRLVDHLYKTEKPIKTQWVSLGFRKDDQEKVFTVLAGLFEETPDGWTLQGVAEDIEKYKKNCNKNKENGKKGGRPRKETQKVILENPTGLQPVNHKPVINKEIQKKPPVPTEKHEVFHCPEGIKPEAWEAWMQIRKAKRTGGITEYGWKLFCNQAAKAGLTPAQAIDLCIERGWQGFKAEWLKREQEPEDDFKRMGRQERERQRLAKQQGQAPAPSSKPASEPQNHDDEIYEELNGLF